jgi:hypothetical protein
MIKKLGTGLAVGVNYNLTVMLIKKKCTISKDFMRVTLLIYMLYIVGLVIGMILKETPDIPYQPITPLFSIFRLIYIFKNPNWEKMQPD